MHSGSARRVVLVGLVVAFTVILAAVSGCAGQKTTQEPAANAPGGVAMTSGMTCPMCTKGAPAVEKGTATEVDGVQIVNITLKDGYYSPNEITLKAGMPAKLIFTGEAKDCSGKPKIAELNQQVDFTKTGEATMDLGAVSPGTYKITCGMDNDGGSLIVQ